MCLFMSVFGPGTHPTLIATHLIVVDGASGDGLQKAHGSVVSNLTEMKFGRIDFQVNRH